MANTYLTRTPSVAGNRKTFTISYWIKRSKLSTEQSVCGVYETANTNFVAMLNTDDNIEMKFKINGANNKLQTNAKFRDTSAWYHIVLAVDTTDGTASNRFKLYVNGTQTTSFDTASYPNQNVNTEVNLNGLQFRIGEDGNGGNHFDGSMSHFHLIDGTAYDASYFGSTDSTTGEWQINTSPSVTYGTNGFFILKDGNSVTDQSGEGNNFTVGGGTLTNTLDCPDNVFATWNPLIKQWSGDIVLANGNTKLQNSNDWSSMFTTIGAETGKYYWEIKINDISATTLSFIGVVGGKYVSDGNRLLNDSTPYDYTDGMLLWQNNGATIINDNGGGTFATYAAGDILGFALDLTSATKTIQFYKNGTIDSAGSLNLPTNMQTDFVFPHAQVNNNIVFANFGNGYFGTTAVSSAGTNASGNGIFEYDVPTGYTALSTKGLNL